MISVLINGCNGKMGQEVAKAIEKNDNFVTCCGVDRLDSGDNKFPVYTDLSLIKENPELIIDFSVPEATFKILDFALEHKIPIIIATTGFTEEQRKKIKKASETIPVFRSGNMSYSVNLMCHLVSEVAKKLTGYDIEIVEAHHNRKIDSPSGTALMLADNINNALDKTMYYEYDRHSKHQKRDKNEIGIHSIRGGNIVGEHTVKFISDNECFEITHTAFSRALFADGALKAGEFIVLQDPGLYDMNNLL